MMHQRNDFALWKYVDINKIIVFIGVLSCQSSANITPTGKLNKQERYDGPLSSGPLRRSLKWQINLYNNNIDNAMLVAGGFDG